MWRAECWVALLIWVIKGQKVWRGDLSLPGCVATRQQRTQFIWRTEAAGFRGRYTAQLE